MVNPTTEDDSIPIDFDEDCEDKIEVSYHNTITEQSDYNDMEDADILQPMPVFDVNWKQIIYSERTNNPVVLCRPPQIVR